MTDLFKPMLAGEADLANLNFPLLASAKLDGIRATVRDGVVMSRSNKPIPNPYVQRMFGAMEHYDGELIVGDPKAKDCFRNTTSHAMSQDKSDFNVAFYAFDHIQHLGNPYAARFKLIKSKNRVVRLEQHYVCDLPTLLLLEENLLAEGFEGLILRREDAPYKRGRSTAKEQYLLKLKRFVDAEAVVIGFEERMHNGNEAVTNELGRTKRSSHQANKTGRGDLGAILVRFGEVEFSIGTGLDDSERVEIWNNRDRYLGQLAKFKYFPVGVKDAPRHPVFMGWRDLKDMS
jgi:DNA ligase-1